MIRVTAGAFRGRRLATPRRGDGIRPTADRTRTILFDVLGGVDAARVLDLFAGTGALGIEALSRRARSVDFVERSALALRLLRANIDALELGEVTRVVRVEVMTFLRRAREAGDAWDLVLADPPYGRPPAGALVAAAADVVAPGGRLVLEHASEDPPPERAGTLILGRRRPVGGTTLSFYSREVAETMNANEEG